MLTIIYTKKTLDNNLFSFNIFFLDTEAKSCPLISDEKHSLLFDKDTTYNVGETYTVNLKLPI